MSALEKNDILSVGDFVGLAGNLTLWLVSNAQVADVVQRAPDALDGERLSLWMNSSIWGLIGLNLLALGLFLTSISEAKILKIWQAYKNWKLEKISAVKAAASASAARASVSLDGLPSEGTAVSTPLGNQEVLVSKTPPAQTEVATLAADASSAPAPTTETEQMASPAADAPPTEVSSPSAAPFEEPTVAETPVYAPPPDDEPAVAATATATPALEGMDALEAQLGGLNFESLTQIGDTMKLAGAGNSANDLPDLAIAPAHFPPEFEPKGATPEEGIKLLEGQLTGISDLYALKPAAQITPTPAAPAEATPVTAIAPPEETPSLPAEGVSDQTLSMVSEEPTAKTAQDFEKSLESLLAETNFEATEELPIFDLRALEDTLQSAIEDAAPSARKDSVA